MMLRNVQHELEKHYYDLSFHGVDLKARFEQAEAALATATSQGQLFGIIALAVLELDDSHTSFIPPQRAATVEYGWRLLAVGSHSYVTAVRPGSDAEAKGLRPGDRVLAVDGYPLTRENQRMFYYRYYLLQPQAAVRLSLEGIDGTRRELELAAEVKPRRRVLDFTDPEGVDFWNLVREAQSASPSHRAWTLGGKKEATPSRKVLLWRMPAFDRSHVQVDLLLGDARAHEAVILDLRGNGGGSVKMLLEVVSHFFDRDLKLGDSVRRKETEPLLAKGKGARAFSGKLMVLVDSASGSAAEVLARVVQLEGRGMVVGDRTAGAVMISQTLLETLGGDTVVAYALQVSKGDLKMADGRSIEGAGVTPDLLLLPSPADLAAGRDPVLAKTLEMLGVELDPAEAGTLSRVEWE